MIMSTLSDGPASLMIKGIIPGQTVCLQVAIAESSKHYVVDGLLTEGNVGASSNALDSGTNVSFCEAPDGPASLMIKDIIPDSL